MNIGFYGIMNESLFIQNNDVPLQYQNQIYSSPHKNYRRNTYSIRSVQYIQSIRTLIYLEVILSPVRFKAVSSETSQRYYVFCFHNLNSTNLTDMPKCEYTLIT